MTLRPCYHATCDAEDCTAHVFLADNRTAACRAELQQLGWLVVEYRPIRRPGAARLIYLCPGHHDWRPADAQPAMVQDPGPLVNTGADPAIRRHAMLWMLVVAASLVAVAHSTGISVIHVCEMFDLYEDEIEMRRRSAVGWQEPWARRLRAVGAIP